MNHPIHPAADQEFLFMLLHHQTKLAREQRALKTAIRRASLVFTVQHAALNGSSKTAALRQAGCAWPTFWRWCQRWNAHGFAGLLPTKPPGRPRSQKQLATQGLRSAHS